TDCGCDRSTPCRRGCCRGLPGQIILSGHQTADPWAFLRAASLSGLILIADLCRSSRTRFWVVGGRGTATARSSSRRRRLGPIFRVPSTGADPSAVTRLTPPQSGHRFPQFLPDGRHFLYYAISGTRETRGVYVGQIDGSEAHRVLDADAAAVYAASG